MSIDTPCKFCGHVNTHCGSMEQAEYCSFRKSTPEERIHPNRVGKLAEQVNHPAHYGGDTTYETVKVLEAWLTPEEFEGALVFNAIKYLSRWRKKGGKQDVEKAQWYVNKLLEKMK